MIYKYPDSDNALGYYMPVHMNKYDNDTGDQCKNAGPAFVIITTVRNKPGSF